MEELSLESVKEKLPTDFLQRMQVILGDEFPAFLQSYEKERSYGLRRNPLLGTREEFEAAYEGFLSPIPWEENGYFYREEDHPGRSILHEAGAVYIQEPSAMLTASLCGITPGEYVCDLCASPGGKSTQALSYLKGEGLLVSNEIVPDRARVLAQNLERLGAANVVVLNEDTDLLASQFACQMDLCIVDAPCSGEGMMRKDERARTEWSKENILLCHKRQLEILENAHRLLNENGRIVYSTCTFAPEENECVVAAFLLQHPEYELRELPISLKGRYILPGGKEKAYEIRGGKARLAREFGENLLPEDADASLDELHLERSIRLFPHLFPGEGHYVALLVKKKDNPSSMHSPEDSKQKAPAKGKNKGGQKKEDKALNDAVSLYRAFAKDNISQSDYLEKERFFYLFGEHLYLLPNVLSSFAQSGFRQMKMLRSSLELGEIGKGRFEPSHALSRMLRNSAFYPVRARSEVELNKTEAENYLQGNVIYKRDGMMLPSKGYVLVLFKGNPLGWGKVAGEQIKNHYPKGLRIYGFKK